MMTSTEHVLLTARETAAAHYVERAASLFGTKLAVIDGALSHRSLSEWVASWLTPNLKGDAAQQREVPTVDAMEISVSPSIGNSPDAVPLADRMLFALSEDLIALHVRPAGHTVKLLRQRLRAAKQPSQTQIAVAPDLIPQPVRDELYGLGAVGRAILEEAPRPRFWHLNENSSPERISHNSGTTSEHDGNQRWLIHCTRRCDGPWPDQAPAEHLEQLILSHPDADHSALATLARIVRSQRLLASGTTVRGDQRVVSFTAVPLAELAALRIFRPHRGRWDFLPYGICIAWDWLEENGARPVKYADAEQWRDQLDRAFVQPATTVTRSGNRIDWTVEQEWRHPGDIDLSRLADHQACVFVKTADEATRIRPVCRWPIIAIDAAPVP